LVDAVHAVLEKRPLPKRILVEEGVFTQDQAAAALPGRKY
jgi:simple sugar transport system substrate-binding protein